MVTGGGDYLCESKLWGPYRIHMTLHEEQTREDDDVKKVLVKYSNTEVVK